jgi:hypothetical protein
MGFGFEVTRFLSPLSFLATCLTGLESVHMMTVIMLSRAFREVEVPE